MIEEILKGRAERLLLDIFAPSGRPTEWQYEHTVKAFREAVEAEREACEGIALNQAAMDRGAMSLAASGKKKSEVYRQHISAILIARAIRERGQP